MVAVKGTGLQCSEEVLVAGLEVVVSGQAGEEEVEKVVEERRQVAVVESVQVVVESGLAVVVRKRVEEAVSGLVVEGTGQVGVVVVESELAVVGSGPVEGGSGLAAAGSGLEVVENGPVEVVRRTLVVAEGSEQVVAVVEETGLELVSVLVALVSLLGVAALEKASASALESPVMATMVCHNWICRSRSAC